MPNIWIGRKHCYETKGVRLPDDFPEIEAFNEDPDVRVAVYLGQAPKYGVKHFKSTSRFIDPFRTEHFNFEMVVNAKPEEGPLVGAIFLEMWTARRFEISQELFDELCLPAPDNNRAIDEAWKFLDRPTLEFLEGRLEGLAGILGLRLHRQLVLVPHDQCRLCFVDLGKYPYHDIVGPVFETLEPIKFNPVIAELVKAWVNGSSEVDDISKPLKWLTLAWQEESTPTKFLALFTALETLLNALPPPKNFISRKPDYKKIRKLISAEPDREERDRLTNLFNRMTEKELPSLLSRFQAFAEECALTGWELDVEAFDRFNRQRNDLVHRGDRQISHRVEVNSQEVRDLEDLAERYISCAIFGDDNVYQSRFRVPRPSAHQRLQEEEAKDP